MPGLFQTFLLGLMGACSVRGHVHSNSTGHIGQNYRIDVHSHVVPQIWKDAMIEAGYPVKNGSLYADGFPVPDWTLKDHIATMDTLGVNYSTISISAPGVYFIEDATKAHALARKINQEMHNYTRQYPRRLGAMCLLPLPHVDESLAEIEVYLPLHLSLANQKDILIPIVLPRHAQIHRRRHLHQLSRHLPRQLNP